MNNDALQQALEAMASNWSKKPQWVEDMMAVWSLEPQISRASPSQINRAMMVCMKELDFAPKLKDFLKALDAVGAAQAPNRPNAPSCQGCQGNRVVEGAIWRDERCHVTSVPCPTCNKGKPLSEWEEAWLRRDASITQIIWGWERPLAPVERGSTRGQVLTFKGKVQFTPNAEALDPHRKERKQAEKALKEEGWR